MFASQIDLYAKSGALKYILMKNNPKLQPKLIIEPEKQKSPTPKPVIEKHFATQIKS